MKLLFCFLISLTSFAQINPEKINIVRDQWGVPHIFAKTDAEVAYGLAYANAEDDFKTMQLTMLIGKGMLGKLKGKDGAAADYAVQLLRCREIVNEKYDTDLSEDFKKLISGYVQGINAYAKNHPKEILVKKSFPITTKDYMTSITFSLCVISGADRELGSLFKGNNKTLESFKAAGSNAFAVSSSKTTDGKTYLNINPHQPLEGPVAWYEAHLVSEEGLNILGGMFPGSPVISLGVNENLGWAHTVNYPDKIDIYQLEINPANKNQYKYDGQWLELEQKTIKLKAKIKGINIPVKKKAYWSKYGATITNDKGTFSMRMGANQDIRGMEQWYRMNKARNYSEFRKAMDMVAIPMFNTMYADRSDTIFYVSNAKIPMREKGYDWENTVPGNTSKTLTTSFHPLKDLPQYLNPPSGYLFNTNHSPFNATDKKENLKSEDFDPTMGYETLQNNRSERFEELIANYDKLSFEDFKRIKYDNQLPKNLKFSVDIDELYKLNPKEYPDLETLIDRIQQWDRKTDVDSKGGAAFLILFYELRKNIKTIDYNNRPKISKESILEALKSTKEYMMTHFGNTEIVLGDYQKLVRGNTEKPMWGMPDVLTASHARPYKDGKVKVEQGESYIALARFSKTGLPEIETMLNYGNSTTENSPHFADQMESYLAKQPKKMTLNKEEILKNAVRNYHPQ
jgi:acyl-homoserine-lactone acylase